jgi:predicted ribosomally synthesized peptide with SipW-like signal peptide
VSLIPFEKTERGERRNKKEMNKKILASIFVIGILALAMGYGTYSFFSDTETSTGNTFTAGTIDLWLSNDGTSWSNGVSKTWEMAALEPGDQYEAVLYMENEGTSGAVVARIKGLNLMEDENGVANAEGKYYTANAIASPPGKNNIGDYIYITDIYYTEAGVWQPWNLADYYAGIMGDKVAPLTLREFCDPSGYSMVFWTGTGNPGDSGIDYLPPGSTVVERLQLSFTFDPAVENWAQSDKAIFDVRVIADDNPSILGKGSVGCYGY